MTTVHMHSQTHLMVCILLMYFAPHNKNNKVAEALPHYSVLSSNLHKSTTNSTESQTQYFWATLNTTKMGAWERSGMWTGQEHETPSNYLNSDNQRQQIHVKTSQRVSQRTRQQKQYFRMLRLQVPRHPEGCYTVSPPQSLLQVM